MLLWWWIGRIWAVDLDGRGEEGGSVAGGVVGGDGLQLTTTGSGFVVEKQLYPIETRCSVAVMLMESCWPWVADADHHPEIANRAWPTIFIGRCRPMLAANELCMQICLGSNCPDLMMMKVGFKLLVTDMGLLAYCSWSGRRFGLLLMDRVCDCVYCPECGAVLVNWMMLGRKNGGRLPCWTEERRMEERSKMLLIRWATVIVGWVIDAAAISD
ncbi:hypothetical protein ACLOJK_027609 [Asimina triloba]